MADPEHVKIVETGPLAIAEWRKTNPDVNLDLQNANLRLANLQSADLPEASLSGADLRGADLRGANLYGADLSGADLSRADLRGADLRGASLRAAQLVRADLRGALVDENTDVSDKWRLVHKVATYGAPDLDLCGADLREAHLRKAILSSANLTTANLSAADLREARLSQANLSGANLCQADLRGATLSQANLTGANLERAKLSHARLGQANLTGANLTEADLSEVDLSLADLTGASLRGANLPEVEDITIRHGILRFVFRAALIWGAVGFLAFAGIHGLTRLVPEASAVLVWQVTDWTSFWSCMAFFAAAGGLDGLAYCCCLALIWMDGLRVDTPRSLRLLFGSTMTVEERFVSIPMLLCSVAIGALLGLFIPAEGASILSRGSIGAIVGLVAGAFVLVFSTRIVDRYAECGHPKD